MAVEAAIVGGNGVDETRGVGVDVTGGSVFLAAVIEGGTEEGVKEGSFIGTEQEETNINSRMTRLK